MVELVTDYLEDALSPADRARFEAHIAGCEGCTMYLRQMREMLELLGELTTDSISPQAESELLATFRDWKRRRAVGLAPAAPAAALVALDRVADEPEHRRPQPDEERAALGVAALVLVDGLGADPQPDAQARSSPARRVQVPAAQADVVEAAGRAWVRATRCARSG